MSDIAIRFDGLFFGCLILLCGVILLIIAIVCAARAHWRRSARAGIIARTCAIGVGACLLSFGALLVYVEYGERPVSGPDWLDWLALPWVAALMIGLARLARRPAR